MPTNNPRVNVTFEPQLNNQLNVLAAHEHKSISKLIKELVIEALEKREDIYLSELAASRDVDNTKTVSHKDAWK
jgi:predicted DNA-binding protein